VFAGVRIVFKDRIAAVTPCRAACSAAMTLLMANAFAADSLDLYAGAAVGRAELRSEETNTGNGYNPSFDADSVGWKVFAGVRVLPFVGVEAAYLDFGNPSVAPPRGIVFGSFSASTRQTAPALFGVGYLPLGPQLDLFGKVGAARLHTEDRESAAPPTCYLEACLPYTTRQDEWSTDLAYGAGAQWRIGALAIRAEYERIQATGGSPNLLSVGASWRFF
jgi:hypothetical protein